MIDKELTTDVNALLKFDDKIITPLFFAIACYTEEKGLDIIKELLKNNANVDYKEYYTGMSALMFATHLNNDDDIVEVL